MVQGVQNDFSFRAGCGFQNELRTAVLNGYFTCEFHGKSYAGQLILYTFLFLSLPKFCAYVLMAVAPLLKVGELASTKLSSLFSQTSGQCKKLTLQSVCERTTKQTRCYFLGVLIPCTTTSKCNVICVIASWARGHPICNWLSLAEKGDRFCLVFLWWRSSHFCCPYRHNLTRQPDRIKFSGKVVIKVAVSVLTERPPFMVA